MAVAVFSCFTAAEAGAIAAPSLLSPLPPPCPSNSVFVSSSGSDANSGCDEAHAVASLSRAQNVSRANLASGSSTTVVYVVASNDGSPIEMTNAGIVFNQGDNGARWVGVPSAASSSTAGAAVVSGGITLPPLHQWAPVTDPSTLQRIRDPAARSAIRRLSLATYNLTSEQIGVPTRHGFTFGAQVIHCVLHITAHARCRA